MSDRVKNLRKTAAFAEERLVARAQSLLHELLLERGWSQTDLANKMGVSKGRVSQIFSDNQNFTLRLLAKAFHAVGEEIEICRASPKVEYKSAEPCLTQDQIELFAQMAEISHGFEWTDGFVTTGNREFVPSNRRKAVSKEIAQQLGRLSDDHLRWHEPDSDDHFEIGNWISGSTNVIPLRHRNKVAVNG